MFKRQMTNDYIKLVLATFGFQIWRPQVIPSLGWSKISRETWLLACGWLCCYQAISRDECPKKPIELGANSADRGGKWGFWAQQNGDAGAEKTCHTHKKTANWARPFAAGLSNLNLIQNQNFIDLTKPRTQETVLFRDFPMPSLNLVKQVLNCVKPLAKGSKQPEIMLDPSWSDSRPNISLYMPKVDASSQKQQNQTC